MAKNLVLIFCVMFFFSLSYCGAQERKGDGQSYITKLDQYIDGYLSTVPPVTDSLTAACDYLISFSQDSVIKSHIAHYLFEKYYNSQIMGMESVAVYIAKNYYLNGKLKWPNKDGFLMLSLFVSLNENSLLGMDAPGLDLPGLDGDSISLREIDKQYVLIYFFDDQCKVCQKELPLIRNTVKQFKNMDIAVYAVYTQSSKEAFSSFVSTEFPAGCEDREFWNFVWDPTFQSGFHLLYNVISTPQLFLLDKDKKIIGRNLNSTSLKDLLIAESSKNNKLSAVTASFIYSYLPLFNLRDTSELGSAFGLLFDKSLTDGGKELYRKLFLEIFDFLAGSGVDSLEDVALYLAENYIIPKQELWWDKSVPGEYVPKIVSRIRSNRVGSPVNDFTLYDRKGLPHVMSSFKGKRFTLLYFFSPECAICKPFTMEVKAIYNTLKKRGVKTVGIDVVSGRKEFDAYLKKNHIRWKSLYVKDDDKLEFYNKFVVDKVPVLYLLDKERKIIARGINTFKLEELTR